MLYAHKSKRRSGYLNHGIGFGETLETLNEFRQLSRVLALDSDAHDRTDAELHLLHVVGGVERRDTSGFDEELIDTDKTADVAARHILDGFDVATHHEDGTLDALLEEVLLLSRSEVGTQNAHFLARLHGSRENATKRVESALVRRGHHLGDVHHQRCFGVAGLHSWKHFQSK